MKITIFGGAGYLGSLLCNTLLQQKYEVICYDNLLYGKESIESLLKYKNFRLIEQDIRNIDKVSKIIKESDAAIHLAGIVGAPAVSTDPITSIETNRLATQAIAELCSLHDIKNLIFASSCSVYGDTNGKKATEKMIPKPLELYAHSKLDSEKDIRHIFPTATILRFGTLMGLSKRMRYDLVVNKFIGQAFSNEEITVQGGDQKRPFLHVLDAVDAILLALNTSSMDGIYNVCSDNYSISGMAGVIHHLSGSRIQYLDDGGTDRRNYEASIEKINRFGFYPKRSLEYTFDEIFRWMELNNIDWHDKKYSNYDSLTFKQSSI